MVKNDKLVIGGHEFSSRFILGSGKYSMKLIEAGADRLGTSAGIAIIEGMNK